MLEIIGAGQLGVHMFDSGQPGDDPKREGIPMLEITGGGRGKPEGLPRVNWGAHVQLRAAWGWSQGGGDTHVRNYWDGRG